MNKIKKNIETPKGPPFTGKRTISRNPHLSLRIIGDNKTWETLRCKYSDGEKRRNDLHSDKRCVDSFAILAT